MVALACHISYTKISGVVPMGKTVTDSRIPIEQRLWLRRGSYFPSTKDSAKQPCWIRFDGTDSEPLAAWGAKYGRLA